MSCACGCAWGVANAAESSLPTCPPGPARLFFRHPFQAHWPACQPGPARRNAEELAKLPGQQHEFHAGGCGSGWPVATKGVGQDSCPRSAVAAALPGSLSAQSIHSLTHPPPPAPSSPHLATSSAPGGAQGVLATAQSMRACGWRLRDDAAATCAYSVCTSQVWYSAICRLRPHLCSRRAAQVRKGEHPHCAAVRRREARLREMMPDVLKEDRKVGRCIGFYSEFIQSRFTASRLCSSCYPRGALPILGEQADTTGRGVPAVCCSRWLALLPQPPPTALRRRRPPAQVRDVILLKARAQVMCTANIRQGVLVNGSRGVVLGFVDAR